jgi:hypothetical protein
MRSVGGIALLLSLLRIRDRTQGRASEIDTELACQSLRVLLPLWLTGGTLRDLELAIGTPAHRLRKCKQAREFMLSLVPEIAYIFGLIEQVHKYRLRQELGDPELPLAATTLRSAVASGFDSPEKLAIRRLLGPNVSRTACHRRFDQIKGQIAPG